MRFKHLSEEEAAKGSLIDAGIYQFKVMDAEDQVSKTGNEMIRLTLRVEGGDGITHTMFDYLLEKMKFKLRHFCEHTGLLARYDSDELCARDCLDREGMCEVIVQEGGEKYDGSRYPDRNAIKDYCARPEGLAESRPAPARAAFDEDIPF